MGRNEPGHCPDSGRTEVGIDIRTQSRDSTHMDRREFMGQWGRMACGVTAGICATAFGAWVTQGLTGGIRIGVWGGVAIGGALVGSWFTDWAATAAGRFVLRGLRLLRRPR